VAKRAEPENVVVDFFTNAPPDTARTVFSIVKGIVDRRGLLQKRKKAARAAAIKDATSSNQG
jgi:hypothetical protein